MYCTINIRCTQVKMDWLNKVILNAVWGSCLFYNERWREKKFFFEAKFIVRDTGNDSAMGGCSRWSMSIKNHSWPKVSKQRQTSNVGNLEPAPCGRWMLRSCTISSVTVLSELGIHVLSLKQAVVRSSVNSCNLCEWLKRAHGLWHKDNRAGL